MNDFYVTDGALRNMNISMFICLFFPIALFLYVWIKKKTDIHPFFIGALTMLLSSFVLGSGVTRAVSGTEFAKSVTSPVWAALFTGLVTGGFEEAGRYIAMKYRMKKYRDKDQDALMYGVGHGGMNAFLIGVMGTMIMINVATAVRNGEAATVFGELNGGLEEAQARLTLQSLINHPDYYYLFIAVERILDMILQLSLSVIVWYGIKLHKKECILYAFIFHIGVQFAASYMNTASGLLESELILMLLTYSVARYALHLWKLLAVKDKKQK